MMRTCPPKVDTERDKITKTQWSVNRNRVANKCGHIILYWLHDLIYFVVTQFWNGFEFEYFQIEFYLQKEFYFSSVKYNSWSKTPHSYKHMQCIRLTMHKWIFWICKFKNTMKRVLCNAVCEKNQKVTNRFCHSIQNNNDMEWIVSRRSWEKIREKSKNSQ